MTCNHQFIRIGTTTKPDDESYQSSSNPNIKSFGRYIEGAIIVCAHCGEVRYLWPDGKIEIKVNGKTSDSNS